jgi:hypothetical protein
MKYIFLCLFALFTSLNASEYNENLDSGFSTALISDDSSVAQELFYGQNYFENNSFEKAIECFSFVITSPNADKHQISLALWMRSTCYYYLHNYELFLKDNNDLKPFFVKHMLASEKRKSHKKKPKDNTPDKPFKNPGDWVCDHCNHVNMKCNESCTKCGKSMKDNTTYKINRTPDWICKHCHYLNSGKEGAASCAGCGEQKNQ